MTDSPDYSVVDAYKEGYAAATAMAAVRCSSILRWIELYRAGELSVGAMLGEIERDAKP
jgi:hypothetical protein